MGSDAVGDDVVPCVAGFRDHGVEIADQDALPPRLCGSKCRGDIFCRRSLRIGGRTVRPHNVISESAGDQLKADHVWAPSPLSFDLVGGGVPPKEGNSSLLRAWGLRGHHVVP